VGATSGIGEFTAKAFVRNTIGPHVYIVGRNASAAERIIGECKELNKDGKVEFLKADVTELGEVDRVCEEIKKRETYINLLVQSQGNLNLRGRDGKICLDPCLVCESWTLTDWLGCRELRGPRQENDIKLLLPHALHQQPPPPPPNRNYTTTPFLTHTLHPWRWPRAPHRFHGSRT
jgi:hypothetical protein